MKTDFSAAMRQALQLVRSQDVMEATRVIQRALLDRTNDASPPEAARESRPFPALGSAATLEAAAQPAPERTASGGEAEVGARRALSANPVVTRIEPLKTDLGAAVRQAVQLVRAQEVMEATRVIQRALLDRTRDASPPEAPRAGRPFPVFGTAETAAQPAPERTARAEDAPTPRQSSGRKRRPLGEVVDLLRQANLPGVGRGAAQVLGLRTPPAVAVPEGSAFHTRSFSCATGSRDYKLYVPSRAQGRALPLVVMLHGCSQNPDDFAVGTGMNALAEEMGFLVAYPRQPSSANMSACWNWFDLAHQTRGEGEPAILAGLTRAVMAEFAVDPARIYVAGLSAGGAMAAIMGATYPDLYAAAGVHSGLPHGAASDLPSGLMAMRGGMNGARTSRATGQVRTIVFHGAGDRVVNPSNAAAILADARAALPGGAQELIQDGTAGGRAYTRTVVTNGRGAAHAEFWSVDGLGHAWSGGRPEGSFTDAKGPDASREMLRFFLEKAAH
ncbi:poly(hydroxyalkanoate) depolymerase family esterase [Roseiarcus fermentans]|uniref:Poly(Hydroxyalkanoate) depolymerase family esterase n=1 Tax=Roseiarcus fermentans TaxID=1473586 RepID=A0A366F3K7_9HYPH|nr:PHB depolymerase family esterase [Roseiarcus fermentans]RBP09231.1 poly(hydroxyalkanoate) depolymerase family esterase [Roseiarcus fermentans]